MLPSFLHGRYADVSRACRKAATRFVKGASLSELPDGWIDVTDMSGYIVVEGPAPCIATEAHYHGYALVARLLDRLDARDAIWERFLDEMLAHTWLIYCCLGADSYFLFMGVEPARRFITAHSRSMGRADLAGAAVLVGRRAGNLRYGCGNHVDRA